MQQRVLASDGELPFLVPAPPGEDADIVLRLSAQVATQVAATEWYRGPSLIIDRSGGGDLVVRFHDGTSFLVTATGRSISMLSAPAQYTRDDVAAYALGPVIAIALHLQGAVLLHAAAAVVRGTAVVFAGESGSGKSTTAAVLHREGYPILADDVTEVVGSDPYEALASIPAVRLWPDALHALFGPAAAFPERAPSWDKKIVLVEQGSRAAIGAILFLGSRGDAPKVERLSAREGWQRLIANVYTAQLPGEAMRRTIFEVTTALAGVVPMYALTLPPIEAAGGLGMFLERELGLDAGELRRLPGEAPR